MPTIARTAAFVLAVAATTVAAGNRSAGVSPLVPLPGAPIAAVATDVDRDGALDLLVSVGAGPRVVFLRGDGAGGFAAAAPLDDLSAAGGTRLLGLAASDVDRDGAVDLVGAGAPPTLWLARGDGTFAPAALGAGIASHVAVADVDRDGYPDVLLITPTGLSVLRNDGVGRFAKSDETAIDAAWPAESLRVEAGQESPVVVVRGGAAPTSLAWIGRSDGTLAPVEAVAVPPEEPSHDWLVRADLDGDGVDDEVAPAPRGADAIVVRLGGSAGASSSRDLGLRAGRLRHLERATQTGVRALVRARIPAEASGRPTRLTLGDPAAPLALALAPSGWTAATGELDVWRGAEHGPRIAVVVDRRRRTLTVSANRLVLPVAPEADVEVSVDWGPVRAAHHSAWARGRRGDLVYRRSRIVQTTAAADDSRGGTNAPGARPAGEFGVTRRTVNGKTLTLLRDRESGRAWRLSADGSWRPADARGGYVAERAPSRRARTAAPRTTAAPGRETVDLNFHGLVDGSDRIRIDAGGATWTNRHWGVHCPVALNGVEWDPRTTKTLPNSGETRFLPQGVDFSTARLVSRSGRDLLSVEAAPGHVTLGISDSPNGPGVYDAVIRFETTGRPTPMLDVGLLAHLPLATDTSDLAVPDRKVAVHSVRMRNGAAVFDGTGWVDLPHVALSNRPFAFALWVRVDGDAPTMGLVEQRAANKRDQHLHLMLRNGQRPYFGFYMDDVITADPVPRDGEFHHLVFQFTGKEKEIWMDGKRVVHRGSGPYRGTAGSTRIGKNPGWNNVGRSHLVGAMRDVRIYARALSSSEIETLAR